MKNLRIQIPLENYQGIFTTDKIDGELDCIIIQNEGKIQLMIESELGYEIFNYRDLDAGVHYIPIRVQPRDNQGHRLNFQAVNYNLNEKLFIQVLATDGNQKEVKLILRYELGTNDENAVV